MATRYIAGYIATGEQITQGEVLTSNVSGRMYDFVRAIGPNKVLVWDEKGHMREFYAATVFGLFTREIAG